MSEALKARELIIGAYTERMAHVDGRALGILSCSYEEGVIGAPQVVATTRNPTYLALSRDGRHLYAVNETPTFDGQAGGGVSAFHRDPDSGGLSFLSSLPSGGTEPCHLCLSPDGRFLLVANYASGAVSVLRTAPDGGLSEMTGHVQHAGSSTHPERQSGPHAHMVAVDPVTGDVLVVDLGLDAVLFYTLTEGGELAPQPGRRIDMAAGSGPRHLAFGPGGGYLFVVNELDNSVVALRRTGDGSDGSGFFMTDKVRTLPTGPGSSSYAAAIRVSPSGRSVVVSNRGADGGSVAVLRFDAGDGSLELLNVEPTGGDAPRDLVLTDEGRFVVVANQDSDNVVAFRLDEEAGGLEKVSEVPVPSPACLLTA